MQALLFDSCRVLTSFDFAVRFVELIDAFCKFGIGTAHTQNQKSGRIQEQRVSELTNCRSESSCSIARILVFSVESSETLHCTDPLVRLMDCIVLRARIDEVQAIDRFNSTRDRLEALELSDSNAIRALSAAAIDSIGEAEATGVLD